MMRMLSDLICILIILFPSLMPAAQLQVKKIITYQDLPEAFCPIWPKGDYFLSNDQFLAITGIGKFDTPLSEKIKLLSEIPSSEISIERY